MYDINTGNWTPTPLIEKLIKEKESGRKLQERKHEDWNDNYELYRNKVRTNRLTQRQAVNIPLMKETIKTLLSRVDDAPNVEWKELGGEEEKELIFQEIWNQNYKDNNLELVDILDKKNVLLYGFSVKKLNITKEGVSISVLDAHDTFFDPLMSSWDLDSARFITHQNIFRTIREILADPKYTKEGKDSLKTWAESPEGILQTVKAKEDWEKKMDRMRAMGVNDSEFPLYAGGDRLVNLTEHFTNVWDTKKEKFVKRVIVYADDRVELYNETLEDCLGVDFWPFTFWSEDPETNDIYPDSVADLVRVPNKVLNVWFSQLIENRTLKNFQMHWFLPAQGYTPQTYTPGPGMMLPAPPGDDVNKVIKPVEISGLDDTMEAIAVLTNIVERSTGATAIEKGQGEQGSQTLGEVEILVGKANERATSMAKFYRLSWYELAVKWYKLLEANAPRIMKLYKEGRSGKLYPKRIFTSDWKSEAGYEPTVHSTSEQELESTKSIQKFQFVMSQFPDNVALRRIAQKRELELLDLTPEELRQVDEAEEQAQQMAQQQAMQAQQQPVEQPQPAQQPMNPEMDLSNELGQLSELMA